MRHPACAAGAAAGAAMGAATGAGAGAPAGAATACAGATATGTGATRTSFVGLSTWRCSLHGKCPTWNPATWLERVFWKVELNVPFNRMSWWTILMKQIVQLISWGEYVGRDRNEIECLSGLQAGAEFCRLTLLSCVWHVTWGTHCHILLILMAAILPINRCGISVIESSSTPITSP